MAEKRHMNSPAQDSAHQHSPHRRTSSAQTSGSHFSRSAHGNDLTSNQVPHRVVAKAQPKGNPYEMPSGNARGSHTKLGTVSATAPTGQNPYFSSGKKRRRSRGNTAPAVIGLMVILVIFGTAIYLVKNPPIFDVSVNGTNHRVNAGMTLMDCIDAGYASPTPGNLMAIDGSVATEGGGDAFAATVNGTPTNDPNFKLKPNEVIELSDGADTTEEYSEKTEAIPFETTNAETSADAYYSHALHIYSEGQEGEKVTRTGKVSGKTTSTVTKEPIDAGYQIWTPNIGDDKVVALTFDDGPWPTTDELLDVLKENDVKATFFTIGNQIAEHPDTIKREHEEGHQVATHSWDHASGSGQGVNLTYMSASEQVDEVDKGFNAIEECLGTDVSHVLRAPGGNFYGDTISNLKGHITAEIGWDVDTMDWSRPGVSYIVDMIESAEPGQVILCHDGGGDRSQTIEALKTALPALKKKGYTFVTVDELIAYGPAKAQDSSSDSSEG